MWLIPNGAATLRAVVVVAAVVVLMTACEPSPPNGQGLLRAQLQPQSPQRPQHNEYGLPARCGVSQTTLDRVAPGRNDEGTTFPEGSPRSCIWESGHDDKYVELSVEIDPDEKLTGVSIRRFTDEVGSLPKEPRLRPVVSLGDEAYAHYDDAPERGDGEATIITRAGNTVAKVKYMESGDGTRESHVTETALQVIVEVAKSLGVRKSDKAKIITKAADDMPTVSARRPACSALSEQTRGRLLDRLYHPPRKQVSSTFRSAPNRDSVRTDSCHWASRSTRLTVETATLADSPEGATAQAARTLDWLQWETQRVGISRTSDASVGLFGLAGHGDGAFAAYEASYSEADNGRGLVAFRIHHAVIRVAYEGSPSKDIAKDQAVNGAYTAAVDVAATFTR